MSEKENKNKAKKEAAELEALRVYDEQESVLKIAKEVRNGRS